MMTRQQAGVSAEGWIYAKVEHVTEDGLIVARHWRPLEHATPEQAAQQQPCDCKQLCERLSNSLPPGRFCMAEAAQEKMRAAPPQAVSDGTLCRDCQRGKHAGQHGCHSETCTCWCNEDIPSGCQPHAAVVKRITNYLSGGGLFNPEMANCNQVRDLLIDCRKALLVLASIAQPNPLDYESEQAYGEDYATWLAAHDQKVRADTLEEAAKLCEAAKVRPDGSCAGHTILDCHSSDAYWIRACKSEPAPAASKPEAGHE